MGPSRKEKFTKGKRKARVYHSQSARPPGAQQSPNLDSQEVQGKNRRESEEKSFRDSSSTERRKVGNRIKPRKTQQRKKRQVCQVEW